MEEKITGKENTPNRSLPNPHPTDQHLFRPPADITDVCHTPTNHRHLSVLPGDRATCFPPNPIQQQPVSAAAYALASSFPLGLLLCLPLQALLRLRLPLECLPRRALQGTFLAVVLAVGLASGRRAHRSLRRSWD